MLCHVAMAFRWYGKRLRRDMLCHVCGYQCERIDRLEVESLAALLVGPRRASA